MSNFWSSWIRDLKIYRRIHSVYPSQFKGCRIESLLPPTVEKLIGRGVVIESGVLINDDITSVGHYLYVGRNTTIGACRSIGNYCSISSGVRIGLMAHPSDYISTSPAFYAQRRGFVEKDSFDERQGKMTTIGHDVLISANGMILNGVTIGNGAIIGAGALVDKDVEPYAVVAGVPAKVLRKRFSDELISRLIKSEWWNLPEADLKKAGNFHNPEQFLQSIGK